MLVPAELTSIYTIADSPVPGAAWPTPPFCLTSLSLLICRGSAHLPPSVSAADVRATFITKQPGSGGSEPPGCPGGAAASAGEMHQVLRDTSVTGSWAALTSQAGEGARTPFFFFFLLPRPGPALKYQVLRRDLPGGRQFDKAQGDLSGAKSRIDGGTLGP